LSPGRAEWMFEALQLGTLWGATIASSRE
jgi:hypothetical protein